MIREFIEKARNKDRKWKEMQEDDRLVNRLEERKLPHNERVLNKLLEEEKQEAIKDAVTEITRVNKLKEKQRESDFMKFNPEWFSDDNCILKQENIFSRNNNLW